MTRAAPALDEDPTQEPNVRTHRMLYPNRRPLLISAILVALTSIPTIIVVAAGTVTLHDRESPRPPAIADPSRGAVVVQPHSSAGLREEPPLASESGHGRPADHTSAEAAGSGGGGAFSLGTGGSQPTVVAPPAAAGATGGKNRDRLDRHREQHGQRHRQYERVGQRLHERLEQQLRQRSGQFGEAREDCPTPVPSRTPGAAPDPGIRRPDRRRRLARLGLDLQRLKRSPDRSHD